MVTVPPRNDSTEKSSSLLSRTACLICAVTSVHDEGLVKRAGCLDRRAVLLFVACVVGSVVLRICGLSFKCV